MSKKLKILFVSHSPFYNGAEICLLTLLKYINRDIFEPVVIFPYDGPLKMDIDKLNIRTYVTPLERWIRFSYDDILKKSNIRTRTNNILNIIDKESVDIVHTNTSVVLEGALAARIKNIPHVWHIHENHEKYVDLKPVFPYPLTYWIISVLSSVVVCVSNYATNIYKKVLDNIPVFTIYNGIGTNSNPDEKINRRSLGLKPNDISVVAVGLLTESKGYIEFIETASIIKQKGCSIKFYWIGVSSKKDFKNFKSKIKKMGLKSTVFYLGFKDNIRSVIKNFDIYFCPSKNESMPLTILEAMEAGLPVISTNWGGAPECVIENKTGFLVPIDDTIKMSDRIYELYKDKNKIELFGNNSVKYFNEKFQAKQYAENFERLYESLRNKVIEPKLKNELDVLESIMFIYDLISKEVKFRV